MPVGSHKDAFLAHQKVKKTFVDNTGNDLPKTAAQILLDFVKNQRQIVSQQVPETIEITDIDKYDRSKVEEALHSVENLCGKCNESHDNNCFVNQARRVLIAMLTGVDVKEKFNGAQSLNELLKIAEEMKAEQQAAAANRAALETPTPATVSTEPEAESIKADYNDIDKQLETLSSKVACLKKDYFELKEKDIFRATLIDEVVDTINAVSSGDFKNPMPVHEDEQLGKIAAAFNTMLETINRMFKNLDSEVTKRSAELKMLMGNIKIGVLTINKEFRINREYSKECLKIFDCGEIGGMNFFDLIEVFDKQSEKKDEIKKFISLYFNALSLDDESMNMLNPLSEHKIKNKYLQISFYPVKTGENSSPESLLVQCVDLTANKLLKMEVDAKDAEGRQIRKMVLNREAFNDFISETVKMTGDALQISKSPLTHESLAELYRIAHTIKGGAGCFDLNELVAHVSNLEDRLGLIIKEKKLTADESLKLSADIANMNELVNKAIVYSGKIFGKSASASKEFEFTFEKNRLDSLIESFKTAAAGGGDINEAAGNFYMLPAGRIFAKSFAMVAPLAQRLAKEVRLEVIGGEIMLPYALNAKLSEVMLHLLRNSVDHAIETPEERSEMQKPFEGLIKVTITKDENAVNIEISDDGRGMDAAKISRAALSKGIISENELSSMSDEQKIALIFRPGFSTKDEVSTVSGRGVGMDIVKNAVENILNGSLTLKSTPGSGSVFNITLKLK